MTDISKNTSAAIAAHKRATDKLTTSINSVDDDTDDNKRSIDEVVNEDLPAIDERITTLEESHDELYQYAHTNIPLLDYRVSAVEVDLASLNDFTRNSDEVIRASDLVSDFAVSDQRKGASSEQTNVLYNTQVDHENRIATLEDLLSDDGTLQDISELVDYIEENQDTIEDYAGTLEDLQNQIDGKADADHTHPPATTTEDGFMSAYDKKKVDSVSFDAEPNPEFVSDYEISSTETVPNSKALYDVHLRVLDLEETDNASAGHVHSVATTTEDGFMSKSDKSKMDGIESGAQKNPIINTNISAGKSDTKVASFTLTKNNYDDIQGLKSDVAGKAATGHKHAINDVTNLQSELNNANSKTKTGNYEFSTDKVPSSATDSGYVAAAVEIREVDRVGTSKTDNKYAPMLVFNWGGSKRIKIRCAWSGVPEIWQSGWGWCTMIHSENIDQFKANDANKLGGIVANEYTTKGWVTNRVTLFSGRQGTGTIYLSESIQNFYKIGLLFGDDDGDTQGYDELWVNDMNLDVSDDNEMAFTIQSHYWKFWTSPNPTSSLLDAGENSLVWRVYGIWRK